MNEVLVKDIKIQIENGKEFTFSIPAKKNIGCMVSGGADSAILLYILARFIREERLGTRVYPITAELLRRPYNIRFASDVIDKVRKLTGFKFEQHLTFPIVNHRLNITDQMKADTMSAYSKLFSNAFRLFTIFDGITANPPTDKIEVTEVSLRPADRDDTEVVTQKETQKGLEVPFVRFDKRDIALLYKKMGILHELFPITRSCEGEAYESDMFTLDCFGARPKGDECWWCKEREYGFGDLI